MRNYFLLSSILIVLMFTSVCHAQRGRNWYRGGGGGGGYGGGYGGWGGGATTGNIYEGNAYGTSEMIRASGEANLNNSEAMINIEEARSKYIDNKLQWLKTRYEGKRMYAAYREQKADKSRARLKLYKSRVRKSGMPRLSADQVDPATGYVNWPEGLQADEFADYRQQLDELLLLKTHTSSMPGLSARIHSRSRSMQTRLKSHIRDLPTIEYIAARKFLDGLAYSGYNMD